MRHLAFRFVRHAPSTAANSQFVVDPYLDYRKRLNSNWQTSLKRRKLQVDYDLLKSDYQKWWNAFATYNKDQSKLNKTALLDNSDGLTNVLKLPNFVVALDFNVKSDDQVNLLQTKNVNDAKTLEWLCTQMRVHFDEQLKSVIQQSPSYRVRPVFLDACNLPETSFPSIAESNNLFTSLVGVSLPAQLAMCLKIEFTKSNKFPLNLLAVGASYQQNSNQLLQQMKASLLSVSDTESMAISSFNSLANSVAQFLQRLQIDYAIINVNPENLQAFEAACVSFNSANECLAKVSFIGTYVSERLNIRVEDKSNNLKFAHLCHVDLNLSKIDELLKLNK